MLAAVEHNEYIPVPVPPRFVGRTIYDYPVGGAQYKAKTNEWLELVDDPQAAAGKAYRLRGEGLSLPVACGARGGGLAPRMKIAPADVPGPGYHWYRVGKVPFGFNAGAFVFAANTVTSYAFEYGSYEVWVSMKFEGPDFAFGPEDGTHTAWLERMILVQPGQDHVKGALSLPQQWTAFGPLERSDPILPPNLLRQVPAQLAVGDRKLPPKTVTAEDGRLDLAPLLGGTAEGRTAYVFIPFDLERTQKVSFGFGADWWFQAWIDGAPLTDTLESGNGAWPPTGADNVVTVPLEAGRHVLAIRFISGTGSSVLAAVGPDGLRRLLHTK